MVSNAFVDPSSLNTVTAAVVGARNREDGELKERIAALLSQFPAKWSPVSSSTSVASVASVALAPLEDGPSVAPAPLVQGDVDVDVDAVMAHPAVAARMQLLVQQQFAAGFQSAQAGGAVSTGVQQEESTDP